LFRYCILFFLNTVLFSQNLADDVIWNGVYKFYNYETEEAIDVLTKARDNYPEHPAVHLTWATARWLHSQANNDIETTYQTLNNDLDEIVPVYEALIQKYPNNMQYQLFYGSAIGLYARISLGKKEWISTLLNAWKGFNVIKRVNVESPEIVDSQLPIGIVEYYAGLSNILVKTAVTIYGLETDKYSGIAKIENAANHGEYSWIEASSVIAFIYLWVLDRPEKSLHYSEKLVNHFPKNYYFNIMYIESLINTGQLKAAKELEEYLKEYLKELTDIQKSWYSGYISYESALICYHDGDFKNAQIYLSRAIENYDAELDIILANAWLLKGKIHDSQKERKQAIHAYNKCIELDNFTAAVHYAKDFIGTPFDN